MRDADIWLWVKKYGNPTMGCPIGKSVNGSMDRHLRSINSWWFNFDPYPFGPGVWVAWHLWVELVPHWMGSKKLLLSKCQSLTRAECMPSNQSGHGASVVLRLALEGTFQLIRSVLTAQSCGRCVLTRAALASQLARRQNTSFAEVTRPSTRRKGTSGFPCDVVQSKIFVAIGLRNLCLHFRFYSLLAPVRPQQALRRKRFRNTLQTFAQQSFPDVMTYTPAYMLSP